MYECVHAHVCVGACVPQFAYGGQRIATGVGLCLLPCLSEICLLFTAGYDRPPGP